MILAGGAGTRFWPLSRVDRPKPLLALGAGRSLLESTIERFLGLLPPDRLIVITGAHLADRVRGLLPALPPANVIPEPESRDTLAPALLGAVEISRRTGEDEALMLLSPCDHWVGGRTAWQAATRAALDCAAALPALVAIGLQPWRPESGYGYILPGRAAGCSTGNGARHVEAFREKPPLEQARQLCAAGWLWNSGVYVWQPGSLLQEVERRVPGGAAAVRAFRTTAPGKPGLGEAYQLLPRLSVDRAVLERGAAAAVVQGGFHWEDLGSWGAVWRAGAGSKEANVVHGNGTVLDGEGNLVYAGEHGGRLVVLCGVDGLVVVDAGDAVLVTRRNRDQSVRAVPDHLLKLGYQRYQ